MQTIVKHYQHSTELILFSHRAYLFKLNNNRSSKDDPNTSTSSRTLPPLDDGIEKLKHELLVSYCVVS